MLTLVRGMPGSGKSTLANALAAKVTERVALVVEADDYFYRETGTYLFDASKLKEAHADCLKRATEGLVQGMHVFVANTFTQRWEYQPYLDAASRLGVQVEVLEARGAYGSIHGVPPETLERMCARWEPHR